MSIETVLLIVIVTYVSRASRSLRGNIEDDSRCLRCQKVTLK
jgi:hypothetical protein